MPYEHRKTAYRDARVAESYDDRFRGAPDRVKQLRDERLLGDLLASLPEGARVLDVPCGTGRLLPGLGRGRRRALGVDVSPEMLSRFRRNPAGPGPAIPLVAGDVERLPLRDGAVDAVVCYRFFFHVDRAEVRAEILRELRRVSAGVVVVEERCRETWKHRLRWVRWRLGLLPGFRPVPGRDEVARELAEAGLRVLEVRRVSALFSDKVLFVAEGAP